MKKILLPFLLLSSLTTLYAADGLKLTEVAKGSTYQKMGLKPGDVIKKVNGQAPQSIDSLFTSIKPGDKVKLLINRNGQDEILHYTLK